MALAIAPATMQTADAVTATLSTQLFDQVLDCKSSRTGASDGVAYDLFQLSLTFGIATFDLLGADKCACSLMALQQTSKFEFPVRPNHSIRIDGQINSKLTHCRELIAGDQ